MVSESLKYSSWHSVNGRNHSYLSCDPIEMFWVCFRSGEDDNHNISKEQMTWKCFLSTEHSGNREDITPGAPPPERPTLSGCAQHLVLEELLRRPALKCGGKWQGQMVTAVPS